MRRDWIRKAKEQDRQIEEVRHGDVPFLEFPLLRGDEDGGARLYHREGASVRASFLP